MRKPSRRSLCRLRSGASRTASLQQRGGRRGEVIRQRRGNGAASSKQGMLLERRAAGARRRGGSLANGGREHLDGSRGREGLGTREFAWVSMDCCVWQVALAVVDVLTPC